MVYLSMWEFAFGFLTGAVTSRILVRNSKKQDAMVQADDVIISPPKPILIPKVKKVFVPGALSNFWGPDSPFQHPPVYAGNTTNSYSS